MGPAPVLLGYRQVTASHPFSSAEPRQGKYSDRRTKLHITLICLLSFAFTFAGSSHEDMCCSAVAQHFFKLSYRYAVTKISWFVLARGRITTNELPRSETANLASCRWISWSAIQSQTLSRHRYPNPNMLPALLFARTRNSEARQLCHSGLVHPSTSTRSSLGT